jgi:hypothetical protein
MKRLLYEKALYERFAGVRAEMKHAFESRRQEGRGRVKFRREAASKV